MPLRLLLGPQRYAPNLGPAMARHGLGGPVAAITAGWEERELEDSELRDALRIETTNLELHRRIEEVQDRDPDLHRARQSLRDTVEELRRLYRRRLDHALGAARELFRERPDPTLVIPERRAAVDEVRRLDAHFLARLAAVRADWWHQHAPADRPAVREHAEAIADLVAAAGTVAIAGGHVLELLSCLRLFALGPTLAERPLVAWSAGAMALSPAAIGFHDSPPQGAGNAEVLDSGLDLCPDLVVLPHASRRLRLDDPHRVALMSRRFAPRHCVAFEDGVELLHEADGWQAASPVQCLSPDGNLRSSARLERPAEES